NSGRIVILAVAVEVPGIAGDVVAGVGRAGGAQEHALPDEDRVRSAGAGRRRDVGHSNHRRVGARGAAMVGHADADGVDSVESGDEAGAHARGVVVLPVAVEVPGVVGDV